MCISGIYALTNEVINNTESVLSTSAVEIELKEYNQSNQPFDEDGKIVMPGDDISLVPVVNNLGIECYLRAKITYTVDGEIFNELDYISGNYSSWTKNGEYYYYDSIVNRNSSIELFNNVHIPDNLTNRHQGKPVILNIVVEAIQAKNFDGNWEGIPINKSVNRTYNINESGSSTIIYENNADQYIDIDDGFFDNLGSLLPGDSVSENVTILNSGDEEITYYLSIDTNDLSNEEKNLLNHINLVITDENGNRIVNSTLGSGKKHVLGTYDINEGQEQTITLELPKSLDNEFSKILTKVLWKFSLNEEPEEEPIEEPIPFPINPETGYFIHNWSIIVFIVSAIGFLVVLYLEKRENDKIEKIK